MIMLKRFIAVLAVSLAGSVNAVDLGVHGPVFEPIEEDIRVILMRMVAAHDWAPDIEGLKEQAHTYTARLPQLFLPRTEKTQTRWKDVGIIVTEDVYLPFVDWETGSVMEPEPRLAVTAGSYFNPITHLPSAAIERLLVFDATDPEQLAFVRAVHLRKLPQLQFMAIAGDVGKLSEDLGTPVFYPAQLMLDKFAIRAVPTLVGFGRGAHKGHMALTEIALPSSLSIIDEAWFGLGDTGEDPSEAYTAQETQKSLLDQEESLQ